ncbi:MAG: hypothetical protein ACTSPI_17415 [Candidatus Heimdallarchaeaceae archaeon]
MSKLSALFFPETVKDAMFIKNNLPYTALFCPYCGRIILMNMGYLMPVHDTIDFSVNIKCEVCKNYFNATRSNMQLSFSGLKLDSNNATR